MQATFLGGSIDLTLWTATMLTCEEPLPAVKDSEMMRMLACSPNKAAQHLLNTVEDVPQRI
jgi:hypothetical protein